MNTTLLQLIRYGIVGVASNAVGYLIYLAITKAGIEHKIAMSLLYGVGVAQTFILNKRWSFHHTGDNGVVFIRYCVAYGLGYFFNLAALYIMVDRFAYPHQIVQGIIIFTSAVLLFMLQKFWVFSVSLPVKPDN